MFASQNAKDIMELDTLDSMIQECATPVTLVALLAKLDQNSTNVKSVIITNQIQIMILHI